LGVDTDVEVDGMLRAAVRADDWLTLEPERLLRRAYEPQPYGAVDRFEDVIALGPNLRELKRADGTIAGRALIAPVAHFGERFGVPTPGAVTVGGLRANGLNSVAGLLDGVAQRAARDEAVPDISSDELAAWATDQVPLLSHTLETPEQRAAAGATVLLFRGDPGNLELVDTRDGWLSLTRLASWISKRPEVVVISESFVPTGRARGLHVDLAPNVMNLPLVPHALIATAGVAYVEWPELSPFADLLESDEAQLDEWPAWAWQPRESVFGMIVRAAAAAWGISERALLDAGEYFPAFAAESIEAAIIDGRSYRVRPDVIFRRA
jgi:hypothetical protein